MEMKHWPLESVLHDIGLMCSAAVLLNDTGTLYGWLTPPSVAVNVPVTVWPGTIVERLRVSVALSFGRPDALALSITGSTPNISSPLMARATARRLARAGRRSRPRSEPIPHSPKAG